MFRRGHIEDAASSAGAEFNAAQAAVALRDKKPGGVEARSYQSAPALSILPEPEQARPRERMKPPSIHYPTDGNPKSPFEAIGEVPVQIVSESPEKTTEFLGSVIASLLENGDNVDVIDLQHPRLSDTLEQTARSDRRSVTGVTLSASTIFASYQKDATETYAAARKAQGEGREEEAERLYGEVSYKFGQGIAEAAEVFGESMVDEGVIDPEIRSSDITTRVESLFAVLGQTSLPKFHHALQHIFHRERTEVIQDREEAQDRVLKNASVAGAEPVDPYPQFMTRDQRLRVEAYFQQYDTFKALEHDWMLIDAHAAKLLKGDRGDETTSQEGDNPDDGRLTIQRMGNDRLSKRARQRLAVAHLKKVVSDQQADGRPKHLIVLGAEDVNPASLDEIRKQCDGGGVNKTRLIEVYGRVYNDEQRAPQLFTRGRRLVVLNARGDASRIVGRVLQNAKSDVLLEDYDVLTEMEALLDDEALVVSEQTKRISHAPTYIAGGAVDYDGADAHLFERVRQGRQESTPRGRRRLRSLGRRRQPARLYELPESPEAIGLPASIDPNEAIELLTGQPTRELTPGDNMHELPPGQMRGVHSRGEFADDGNHEPLGVRQKPSTENGHVAGGEAVPAIEGSDDPDVLHGVVWQEEPQ